MTDMTKQEDFFFKYGHGDIKLEFPSTLLLEGKKGWLIYPPPAQIPVDQVKVGGKFTMDNSTRPTTVDIDENTWAEITIHKKFPLIITSVKEMKRIHKLLIKTKLDKK